MAQDPNPNNQPDPGLNFRKRILTAKEDELSLADLWERKRLEGFDKAGATQYTQMAERRRARMAQAVAPADAVSGVAPQPVPGAAPQQDRIPLGEGIAKQVVHGATLGFADEAVGVLGATLGPLAAAVGGKRGGATFSDRYRHFRDSARGDLEEFEEQNPKTAAVADFAGGMLFPGGIAANLGRKTGMTLGRKALVGGAEGAAVGAAAGAGYSDDNSFLGALIGGTVGGLTGGAIPVGGAAGRGLYNIMGRPNLKSAGTKADDLIVEAIRNDGKTIHDVTPELYDVYEGDQLVRPADFDPDSPVGLLDLFGENVLRLGRGAVTAGDEATDQLPKLLRNRVETQQGRILNKVQEATGVQHRSTHGTKEDIIRNREALAEPFYSQLDNVGKVDDAEVDALVALPKVRSAYNSGVRTFKKATDDPIPQISTPATGGALDEKEIDGLFNQWKHNNSDVAEALGEVPNKREFLQQAGWLRPDGSFTEDVPFAVLRERFQTKARGGQGEANRIARLPSAKGLHYTKRMLDSQISRLKRSGDKEVLRELTGLKSQLLGRMDELLKNAEGEQFYKKGREIYAGESALLDALEEGRQFFHMHPDEINRYLAELTEGEREMFLLGGIDVMSEVMMKTANNQNLYNKVFGNDWKREQIRGLFAGNSAGYDAFERLMNAENRMAKSMSFVTGGSNTANKQADLVKLTGMSPLELTVNAATGGGLGGILAALVPKAVRERKDGVNAKIADELGKRLAKGMKGTPEDRAELVQYLMSLQPKERTREQTSELAAAIHRALSAEAGELTGKE